MTAMMHKHAPPGADEEKFIRSITSLARNESVQYNAFAKTNRSNTECTTS